MRLRRVNWRIYRWTIINSQYCQQCMQIQCYNSRIKWDRHICDVAHEYLPLITINIYSMQVDGGVHSYLVWIPKFFVFYWISLRLMWIYTCAPVHNTLTQCISRCYNRWSLHHFISIAMIPFTLFLETDCGSPIAINNGSITLHVANTSTYGAFANVSCDTGYNASIEVVTCLETGTWEAASCLLKGRKSLNDSNESLKLHVCTLN